MASKISKAKAALREYALSLPSAREDFPWGERVVKVGKKVFVFLGVDGGDFGLSVKLPESGGMALALPFTEPTGYGLGKAGWVSAKLPAGEEPPLDMLREWILESYRAVAPKKLAATLAAAAPAPQRPAAKRATPKKSAPKKAARERA
jgi:predicted DNA-binding protein (MmcQ/YjbR family)